MAKSLTPATNPVSAVIATAIKDRSINRSTCDRLINEYSTTYPDEMDALLEAIRMGLIVVQERR